MTRAASSADLLPAYCRARVLILGVGNVLFGDDGFGPETVAYLVDNYELPQDVCALDVGTGVQKLLLTLSAGERVPQEIVLLDACDGGAGDREVGEVPLEALGPGGGAGRFSLHLVPSSDLLRQLRDARGVEVSILACDVGPLPEAVRPGLSPAARLAVATAARRLAQRLGAGRAESEAARRAAR